MSRQLYKELEKTFIKLLAVFNFMLVSVQELKQLSMQCVVPMPATLGIPKL